MMPLDIPLHPIVVHFPVALLVTGFFLELAGRILGRDWLSRAALVLLVAGALGAVAAARSGEAEEDRILETPAIEETLEEHEEGGKRTMWIFLVIAALRSGLTWRKLLTPILGWVILVLWAAGLVVLVDTAHHGGQLVYRHGAGVIAPAPPRPD